MTTSSASRPAGSTFRISGFDRLILRGRDPYRPVYLLRFERLRWTLVIVSVVVLLFSGVIAWVGQAEGRRVCLERNESALHYRVGLDTLARLAHERRQLEDEAIYRSLRPRDPLPRC